MPGDLRGEPANRLEGRAGHRLEAFPAENFLIDSGAPRTLPYPILPGGGLDR